MFKKITTILTTTAIVSISLVNLSTVNAEQVFFSPLTSNHADFSRYGIDKKTKQKIKLDKDLGGEYIYIIQLKDKAVVNYDGAVSGYPATALVQSHSAKPSSTNQSKHAKKLISGKSRIDFSSKVVQSYTDYLKDKQQQFFSKITKTLSTQPEKIASYMNVINGMALRLTQSQAAKIARFDEVLFIEREHIYQLQTDRGPTLIGAPQVWDGTATGGVGNLGEGVIIGIIDTGINSDHPSFSAMGDDGYQHINPLGSGVFIGDCASAFPELCNDKLIGVRHYAIITDNYSDTTVFGNTPPAANGEDYNGHGSHTAGTAGGNILKNVDLIDLVAAEESDGINSTGFKFPQISGVAPHANIIAYQVCSPGEDEDTYSSCPGSALIAGINDAVADGVDVINYSIGGDSAIDPWSNGVEQAFLSAQAAGIFVATSAGNSGPDTNTAFKPSPWYTAVAASTHGRTIAAGSFLFETHQFAFQEGSGSALTTNITAPTVYSGHVNANNIDGCAAFSANDFANSIALIKRGNCNFSVKIDNATTAGALAVVIFNNDGDNSLVNMSGLENTTIPSVFIANADGVTVVNSLATTPGINGTIQLGVNLAIGQFDRIASFSSRGPGVTLPDVMVPQVAAPGVSIYAAFSDQQFGHDVSNPASGDFAFLQGTSMASPHVAGAAALLTAEHPTWTPDNIRSALMMTAVTAMTKDGTNAADIFDRGAGRIQVDLAAKSGLVMNEIKANYDAADPDAGGDPKTLNIPSMGNMDCRLNCSWTRTVTATKAASWNVTSSTTTTGMILTVSPSSFTLDPGESQLLTIAADVSAVGFNTVAQGQLIMTASDANIPVASMPVFAKLFSSNLATEKVIEIHRNSGSVLVRGIEALEITDFAATTLGLNKANKHPLSSKEDSKNNDVYDDFTDGITVTWVNLATASRLLMATLKNTAAPDLDLYVGRDNNADNTPSKNELLCISAGADSDETCLLEDVSAGNYWILVQNFRASSTGATDSYELLSGSIADNQSVGNLTITGPQTVAEFTPFDIRLQWDESMLAGDLFIGQFALSTDPMNLGNLGSTFVLLERETDDVSLMVSNSNPVKDDVVTYTVTVEPNSFDENITYNISSTFVAGINVDVSTLSVSSGSLITNSTGYSWEITAPVNGTNNFTLTYQATVTASPGTTVSQDLSSDSSNIGANTVTSTGNFTVKSAPPPPPPPPSSGGGGGSPFWLLFSLTLLGYKKRMAI